jgi:hypothetical protein
LFTSTSAPQSAATNWSSLYLDDYSLEPPFSDATVISPPPQYPLETLTMTADTGSALQQNLTVAAGVYGYTGEING